MLVHVNTSHELCHGRPAASCGRGAAACLQRSLLRMARSVREILVWNPADELLSPACEGLLNEARSVHLRLQDALDRGQPIKTALASLACNMGADSEDEELAELRMFVSDVIAIAKAAKAPHRTERCKAEHRMRVQASYTSEDSHPSFVSPKCSAEWCREHQTSSDQDSLPASSTATADERRAQQSFDSYY